MRVMPCLQDLAALAPLETKVDDLLDLDEESLKTMLNPDSLEEVRNKSVLFSWQPTSTKFVLSFSFSPLASVSECGICIILQHLVLTWQLL